jgi:hypothetical protein
MPINLVTHLKARVLNGADHAVLCPRGAEGQQMPTGLEHPKRFAPHLDAVCNAGVVPSLAHEAKLIGRICHDAINARVVHQPHLLDAVALYNSGTHTTYSSLV